MADNHDYLALDWVRNEIQETLNQAQQTLESYVDNPADESRMRFCQTYLHQVHGTLKIVEFYGAALLAEEMEQLAEALLNNKVTSEADAQETLMRAILQVPSYLDRVQASRRDLPMVLLPLLNDLRAVRGAPLMSETALFKPDLSAIQQDNDTNPPASQDDNFPQLARKLRQMYQIALLGVLRDQEADKQLHYLMRVLTHLEKVSGESSLSPLWAIAAAMVEALQEKSVDLSVAVKLLFGHLDRQLRELTRQGAPYLQQLPPTELLKNLLYYVAKSDATSPRVVTIKNRFRLSDALLTDAEIHAERERMSGPDQAAISSVVQALSEELGKVKASLEQQVQEGSLDADALQEQVVGLKQIADTLAVLGLGQPRERVVAQLEVLQSMVAGETAFEVDQLMDVAGALLYVESALAGMANQHGTSDQVPEHIARARDAVLRECHTGLEEAKDGIVEFIASQWDQHHLEAVPQQLNAVRGGLAVVYLNRPALVLQQCSKFIEEQLLGDAAGTPEWHSMDTLADALTGVEYYLERLSDDPETTDDVLKVAYDSVRALGYELTDEQLQQAGDADRLVAEEQQDDADSEQAINAAEFDGTLSDDSEDNAAQEDDDITLSAVDWQEESTPDISVGLEEAPAIDTSSEADNSAADSDADDELIDDEIIEIFVEEAGEVIEALNDYFPRWAADTSDQDALTEFRRAFHTLKGSGRMVGAMTVGELAWAIENMMNRVIDNTIEPTSMLIELVRRVHGLIPTLVDDFAQRRSASVDVTALMHAADTLAAGEQVDQLPDVSVASDDDQNQGDTAASESDSEESTLLDIFIVEAQDNLDALNEWLSSLDMEISRHRLDDSVHRWLHTLKGSARMAEVGLIAEVAEPAEKCVKELINMSVPADRDFIELLEETHGVMCRALAELRDQGSVSAINVDGLIAQYQGVREGLGSDGGAGIDGHLLAVFLSEGMDIILDAEATLDKWASQRDNLNDIHELGDELELLANSSATAGLQEVHQMAAKLALCCKAVNGDAQTDTDQFVTLARAGQDALINMMDCLAAGQTIDAGTDVLEQLQAWLDETTIAENDSPTLDLSDLDWQGEDQQPLDANTDADIDLEAFELDDAQEADEADDQTPAASGERIKDEALGDMFFAEADDILTQAQQVLGSWNVLENWQPGTDTKVAELQRQLHILKGGARMAGVTHIADLAHELEFIYDELAEGQRQPSPELYDVVLSGHNKLTAMVDELRQGGSIQAAEKQLAAIEQLKAQTPATNATANSSDNVEESAADNTALNVSDESDAAAIDALEPNEIEEAASEETTPEEAAPEATPQEEPPTPAAASPEPAPAAPDVDRDPELVEIFLEEAEELVDVSSEGLESWLEAPDNLNEVQSLQRYLHTLKGGARMAELPALGDLSHELETLYEGLGQKRLQPAEALFDLLHRCHDRLADMVDAIRVDPNQPIAQASDLITLIKRYVDDPNGFVMPDNVTPPEAPNEATATDAAPAAENPTDEAAPQGGEASEEVVLPADFDPDILEVFLEEAGELSEKLDSSLTEWREAPSEAAPSNELRRVLHTLKGGARLAGLTTLGDMSHEAESLIEKADKQPDDAFFDKLIAYEDSISSRIEKIQQAARQLGSQTAAEPQQTNNAQPAKAPLVASKPAAKTTPQQDAAAQRKAAHQPQEMVRVGADVLESLLNLAGETSINRGRVEQGVGEFTSHINEMGNTVERLYGQLRRLDIETEAQILSNYKQGVESGEYGEGFDPLEMDQYSELHQITKQLSESASDLLDLRNSLLDQTRDAETLLLQQSRINTELQESLMRTRMVPFTRMVPRLRRIVRQISGELHKKVDFNVLNPEGELDRTLMERIVAPLEHLLRNAVDHGIETADKRSAAGKPESGNVGLELKRDGGDVLLILTDDGGGINTDAVKEKAIERGLITPDSDLTDQEIQQFIFSAGFSTAKEVTQISGRGVGMDVVASDIKQLGGAVEIDSTPGKGTTFTVRLPFTLAMNRALLVKVGEDHYAIPLTQVEGIVRISPFELEEYLDEEAGQYVYAGQHYDLEYLGQYVHDVKQPNLEGVTTPLPLLLLHSKEHQVALVVDSLLGSRQVVVKSVGPQLSTVAGLNGATILGDGAVVIILDIHALIRTAHLQQQAIAAGRMQPTPEVATPSRAESEEERAPLVMVTDDSVTVRKVTTRLLERRGYEVITAKDGMDAVAKLEDYQPDIMLLDIEMPRMDGFEVASHMRHDSRFQEVPIIMITSRTGEKHRERGFDIGVNSYMGKPFQEAELLSTISELLAKET